MGYRVQGGGVSQAINPPTHTVVYCLSARSNVIRFHRLQNSTISRGPSVQTYALVQDSLLSTLDSMQALQTNKQKMYLIHLTYCHGSVSAVSDMLRALNQQWSQNQMILACLPPVSNISYSLLKTRKIWISFPLVPQVWLYRIQQPILTTQALKPAFHTGNLYFSLYKLPQTWWFRNLGVA